MNTISDSRFRIKLHTKFAGLTLIVVLSVAFFWHTATGLQEKRLERKQLLQHRQVTCVASQLSADYIYQNDTTALEKTASRILSLPNVLRVQYLDFKGQKLLDAKADNYPGETGKPFSIRVLSEPIIWGTTDIGEIRIEFDRTRELSEIHSFTLRSLIFLGLLVVAIVVISFVFFSRSIARPIRTQMRAYEELGKGNLRASVQVTSRDEFGELGSFFNKAVEALRRANRALKTLSECNQVLVRATNESKLLHEMCRIIVEVGGYRLAWIGLTEHDEEKTVRPVAHEGYEEGYLETLNITWSDTERGRGPTGAAIRTGEPVITRHMLTDPKFEPWRDGALKRGYASSIALPLVADAGVLGALNIYAREPEAFDEGEVRMLTELADDTAYGIMALHTRAERERAEQALRESEEKYRDILESISDLVQSVAPNGKILYVNRGWRETLGYTEEEVTDLSLFDIIHPDSKAHCTEVFQRVFSGEVIQNVEAVFVAKDGKQIAVEGSASCKFEGDKPVATMGIFRDITERKKAEEAKRKIEAQKLVVEELKKIDRMKDEFIGMVAHELRNPMTPLKSVTEMFLDGSLGEMTPKQREYVDMMARNIDRLSRFTQDVMSLARLDGDRYPLHPARVPLFSTLQPTVILMGKSAEERNMSVSIDIPKNLYAYADADAVSEVVTNLVKNAVVHTPQGTAISVSAKLVDESFVEVSVTDNGQGIPEDMVNKIFDRFVQAGEKKGPGYKGSGIGLAVCKSLVGKMGGDISVESHLDEGTVFSFTLPTSPPQEKSEEAGQ
jgi:PAS domain S-box-containing protein